MSPKKGVRSNRNGTEKTRTVIKEKAQRNKVASLKVSVPLKKCTVEDGIHVPMVKGSRPPQFTKHLDIKTKLELANSVARQQLVKEERPVFELDNVVFIKKPKKRGRKKKDNVISNYFLNQNMVIENNTAETIVTSTGTKLPEKLAPAKKPTPPKKEAPTRRILTRKRLADSKAQDAKQTKVEPNEDSKLLDAKIKLEDTSQEHAFDEPVEPECEPVVQPTPVVVQPLPVVAQSKPEVARPQTAKKTKSTLNLPQPPRKRPATRQPKQTRAKRGPKCKQQNVQPDIVTSSIADILRTKPSETELKTKENQQNTPGLVESRKNSVGSSSNMSWTRDISSSSNNTCIGLVCSNDFIRIDKKLPVVKLTNIDNEVKKRQNEARELITSGASAVVDEIDEDLSCDSDSSDGVRKFSEQLNDSIGAHSLHLSTSSTSQFTQSRRNETSTDYAKAADKLSLTLEKLDMEIINWMSSENEDVNANLVKFKDKMFDILDNEFGVITHCRRLKEILEPPRKEDIIDEICISDKIQDRNTNKHIENTQIKESAPVHKNASPEENTKVAEITPIKENSKARVDDFVKPNRRPSRRLSNISEVNILNTNTRVSKDKTSDDEMQAGTSNNFYDHHDDDDTLSLFAESISNFESTTTSRINTSNASVYASKPRPVEEYIPKPVKDDAINTEKHVYFPTKIREDAEAIASKMTTVCEKQNADSTSIYKQSISTDDAESYQDFTENTDLDTRLGPPDMVKKPRLMDSYFEGMPKAKSVVFGNLCFYNLMNCCRKVYFRQCRFVHMIPTSEQIKNKLNQLDDRLVIQEYLLLRNWTELRRRYGMCYVEECAKRGLTRILVEIAYDFIVKAKNEAEEDVRLRVATIELTLLHLNTVDLSVCEDLLTLPIRSDQGNRTLLCDVLMATMSITQNFSRFKIVFLNLTYFMVGNDRTFNKEVVEHILERVCILPFDDTIARALIQMMRLTKSDIFNNSMIAHFEKQISVNKDVFDEYKVLKNQCAFSSMLASSVMMASPPLKVDTMAALPDEAEPQPPVASPDTTNLDNMHKTTEEPSKLVITRTIGMNPPIIFSRPSTSHGASRDHVNPGHSRDHVSPGYSRDHVSPGHSRDHVSPGHSRDHVSPGHPRDHVNTGPDINDNSIKVNVRKWRNRSIFPHMLPPPMASRPPMRGTPTRGGMRPPMRPQMMTPHRLPFNQRVVLFKSPSNYGNRQPGPKY